MTACCICSKAESGNLFSKEAGCLAITSSRHCQTALAKLQISIAPYPDLQDHLISVSDAPGKLQQLDSLINHLI